MKQTLTILFVSLSTFCCSQGMMTPWNYVKPHEQTNKNVEGRQTRLEWVVAIIKPKVQIYSDQGLKKKESKTVEFNERFYVAETADQSLKLLTLDNAPVGWCAKGDVIFWSNKSLSSYIDYTLIKVVYESSQVQFHPEWNPGPNDELLSKPIGFGYLLDRKDNWLLINSRPRMSRGARWVADQGQVFALTESQGIKSEDSLDFFGGSPFYGNQMLRNEGKRIAKEAIDLSFSPPYSYLLSNYEITRIKRNLEELIEQAGSAQSLSTHLRQKGAQDQDMFLSFYQQHIINIKVFSIPSPGTEVTVLDLTNLKRADLDAIISYSEQLINKLNTISFTNSAEMGWVAKETFVDGFSNLLFQPITISPSELILIYLEKPAKNNELLSKLREKKTLTTLINSLSTGPASRITIFYPCSGKDNLCRSNLSNNFDAEIGTILGISDRVSVGTEERLLIKKKLREVFLSSYLTNKHERTMIYLLTDKDVSNPIMGLSDISRLVVDLNQEFSNYQSQQTRFFLPANLKSDFSDKKLRPDFSDKNLPITYLK